MTKSEDSLEQTLEYTGQHAKAAETSPVKSVENYANKAAIVWRLQTDDDKMSQSGQI